MQYWWTWFYFVLYLMGFFFIERFSGITSYHLISLAIDHQLPFNEWFVFFYYLWFPFIFFTFAYLFFNHKRDYLKMITFLYVGMTLFLVISLVYPNKLDIRPAHLANTNIARYLCNLIWAADTPTNVLPSIHIYDSIGMAIALNRCEGTTRIVKYGSIILAVMIILSTFLIKQHGLIDAFCAVILSAVMYVIIYKKKIYFLRGRE